MPSSIEPHRHKIGGLGSSDFGGGGGKEKSLPPIFSPLGGPRAQKFMSHRGLVAFYISLKLNAPTAKNGVRGRLLPVSKNFH